jgi:hypothetical protein
MADFMGLPDEVRPVIKDWTHRVRFLLEPGLMTSEILADVRHVLEQYTAMFRDVIRKRGDNPGDDLLGQLMTARVGGEELTEEEIIFAGIMTFVAGHETTKSLLGNGLLALLRHPEELERLRHDGSLLPSAVNEMFRYESPLQQTKRKATGSRDRRQTDPAWRSALALHRGGQSRSGSFSGSRSFRRGTLAQPTPRARLRDAPVPGGLLAKTEAQVVFGVGASDAPHSARQ